MKQNDRILIIAGLVAGVVGLVVMIGFIGQGNIRHVEIFWTEKVEQTIVFQEIDGETQIQAIKGVKGDNNPTLISRTAFAYILTVINNGFELLKHRFENTMDSYALAEFSRIERSIAKLTAEVEKLREASISE